MHLARVILLNRNRAPTLFYVMVFIYAIFTTRYLLYRCSRLFRAARGLGQYRSINQLL